MANAARIIIRTVKIKLTAATPGAERKRVRSAGAGTPVATGTAGASNSWWESLPCLYTGDLRRAFFLQADKSRAPGPLHSFNRLI
jgi:hypothetical protein